MHSIFFSCLLKRKKKYQDVNIIFVPLPMPCSNQSQHWRLLLTQLRPFAQQPELCVRVRVLYQRLLAHLAHALSTKDFVSLLPDDGNVAFFAPYVQMALAKGKADKITIAKHTVGVM